MKIRKDMSLVEVVRAFPETIPVFMSYGMGCIGCAAAMYETIEQGALAHGIDVDALVRDLNKAVSRKTEKEN